MLPDFLADTFQEDIMAHSLDKIGGKSGGTFHKLQIKTYNNVRYAYIIIFYTKLHTLHTSMIFM